MENNLNRRKSSREVEVSKEVKSLDGEQLLAKEQEDEGKVDQTV